MFRSKKKPYKMKKQISIIMVIALLGIAILSYMFVLNDESYYHQPIAKITAITQKDNIQYIHAKILNGTYRNEEIELTNSITKSEADTITYKVNDKIFIKYNGTHPLSASIQGLKRDHYLAYIILVFIFLIILIGGIKGFRSLMSVIVNIVLFYAFIQFYLHGANILLITAGISLLFIVSSLYFVNGANRKTVSAIVGTVVGTGVTIILATLIFKLTGYRGVYFEAMELIPKNPQQIYFVEIIIGTLGGIMDIAITMSSSVKELIEQNPNISKDAIINSGMEIGKDIMGTMANTVVFAYISGSIPLILLFIVNGIPLSTILGINMSLEIVRALTTTIGIILSIPITLEIAVWLLKRKEAIR